MNAKLLLPTLAVALGGFGGNAHGLTLTNGEFIFASDVFAAEATYYLPAPSTTYITSLPGSNLYEFVVNATADVTVLLDASWALPPAMTEPTLVRYMVQEDGVSSIGGVYGIGPWLADVTQLSTTPDPFFSVLMEANKQYLMWVTSFPDANGRYTNGAVTNVTAVSAVPLPGAVWLFGSALLSMFGFKARKGRLASA
jgi:hypothetical protein